MEFSMMNHLKMLEGEMSTWPDVSANSHRRVGSQLRLDHISYSQRRRPQACPVADAAIMPALRTEDRD
jgi:hypothetical protein